MTGLGLLVLRLALAVVFVAHGANILFGMWAGPGIGPGGLRATAAQYGAFGLHPESVFAVLAGIVQLAGGLLLALGSLMRPAALALAVYVGIGIWIEHLRWGFFLNWTRNPQQGLGIEYSLTLAAALVCLILAGPGDWSLDARRRSRRSSRAAGRARIRRN
jgi:putative oxidoreductase